MAGQPGEFYSPSIEGLYQSKMKKSKKSKNPNNSRKTDPYFKYVVDHISRTWKEKRAMENYYPFTGRDFKLIKDCCRTFQAWNVMALWDRYLDTPNEFNDKHNYTILQFTYQLPKLLDSPYKTAGKLYLKTLESAQIEAPGPLKQELDLFTRSRPFTGLKSKEKANV